MMVFGAPIVAAGFLALSIDLWKYGESDLGMKPERQDLLGLL
jgi:hypothetical protein